MDWVTGLVPGGKENFNAYLIIVNTFRNSVRLSLVIGTQNAHQEFEPTSIIFWLLALISLDLTIHKKIEVQLSYNTSQYCTTGKTPALVEKGWNYLLSVDHLKSNLLTIHTTAKDFHEMWKRACDTAAKCIAEAKEYNKKRWDKSHREDDFREGDQVLVSTLRFNNLKGPKKMRDSFVGPFNFIKLIWQNAV
ncbi:hypothetical protein O181_032889 [Austropuccinia psidii MF-1]|uniref:Uncharacterized protein n=1 Tax=Austropuccinia psidii MF-1 TaxID=1389203 RepID=A0A9Q3CY81_9BASI|nr:hypothetical protein [Austropuccinia psidii MF-1]